MARYDARIVARCVCVQHAGSFERQQRRAEARVAVEQLLHRSHSRDPATVSTTAGEGGWGREQGRYTWLSTVSTVPDSVGLDAAGFAYGVSGARTGSG